MPRKNSKITERWREVSDELADAVARTPEDKRFSWEKAQDDINLPTYEDLIDNEPSDSGFLIQTAPTENPKRPRASTISYNPNTKTVVIVFRDGTWWQYNDVGPDIWMGLKNSPSTSSYLPTLESNCSSHGPANVGDLSEGTKAQINQNSLTSNDIQKSGNIFQRILDIPVDISNVSSEEPLKD